MPLKKLNDNENFFDTVNQSKSIISYKINLRKFLKRYPVLKNPTLSSNFFKNKFKLIKMVCKTNAKLVYEADT